MNLVSLPQVILMQCYYELFCIDTAAFVQYFKVLSTLFDVMGEYILTSSGAYWLQQYKLKWLLVRGCQILLPIMM